jgi:DNA-binding transcriptional LysR family regulator
MDDFDVRGNERWCREVLSESGTFHAACVYKTRHTAGVKLNKKGQSVGRSIARLESLLHAELNGGFLVDPAETRRVVPTDAGKLFWKYCEDMAALRIRLQRDLLKMQRGSEIRVATTQYAWQAYGGELEKAYRAVRPDGTLNPGGDFWEQDRVWEEIEARVMDGSADIGIYSFPPSRRKEFPAADLSQIDLIEEEFVLVLGKGLAKLVKGEKTSLYELSQLIPNLPKILHYRRDLGFDRTDLIEDYLRRDRVLARYGERADWLDGFGSILEIKDKIIKDGGISFLPWPTVAQEHKEHKLKAYPLHLHMRPRVIKLIYRSHNCRSSVSDFIGGAKNLTGARRFSA